MWKNGMRRNKTPIKRNSQRQKKKKTVGERWTQAEFMYFIMPSARLWSMSHYHFNADCSLRLSGSSSLTLSLPPRLPHGFPSLSPPPSFLRWHNPSSSGCNVEECEPAAGNGEKTLRCELGWERNPLRGKKKKKKTQYVCVCVCWCVPTAFNVMLIQFIFNEETVSSYREAKEISGLLHSGKSIAHLFILLFELFVCLKKKQTVGIRCQDKCCFKKL